MRYTGNVCDVHIHVEHMPDLAPMVESFDRNGLRRYTLQGAGSYAVAHRGISNVLGLLQKLRDPGRCYAFANLDHPDVGCADAESLLAQVKMYHEAGFDGIKMIEGKPTARLRTGVQLDDPRFDPMFDYMEAHDIPLLSHVNDPRFFWDITKMQPYQIKAGWYAGPECSPFEQVRAEALRVMRRHPGLRTVFAHFFFASASPAEADAIFDAYPNVSFDLTPGTHYTDMAEGREQWRDFFERRADRLLFGTDNCRAVPEDHVAQCRRILETADVVDHFGTVITCLDLSRQALEKIYETNFVRYIGERSRTVQKDAFAAFAEWSCGQIADSANAGKLCAEIRAAAQSV